jgi:transposase
MGRERTDPCHTRAGPATVGLGGFSCQCPRRLLVCDLQGRDDSGLFIEMLKVLMHRRRKPLILILDSLPAHKGKAVRNYVESTNGKLELHFLPGYAPELNPDELVWNYMKRTGTARSPMAKGESLHERIDEELFQIKWNPALVRSFFKAKDVSYISDRLVSYSRFR